MTKRDRIRSIVRATFAFSLVLFPFSTIFAEEEANIRSDDNRQVYIIGQENFKRIFSFIQQRYEDPDVNFSRLLARGLYEAEHLVTRVEGATEVITLATYAPPYTLQRMEYVTRIDNLILSRARIVSGTVTSVTDLWNTTLASMVNALDDPYTQYLPPRNYNDLQQFLSGEGDPRNRFFGVGISVDWDYAGNAGLLVVEPLPGTPAFLANIQPGDVIVAVDDVPLSVTGTLAENQEAAVNRIRGREGTQVKLTILRRGAGVPFPINFVLERKPIREDQLISKEVLDKETGRIQLRSFYQNCAADVRDALRWLRDAGMKKLILDFRYNPGGFLDEAVKVADLFLPQDALITYTQGRTEDTRNNFWDQSTDDEGFTQIPIVILVDHLSASASEVVTGALKDSGRARVVGVKTFGKGSVQELFQLAGNAGLRLTVAKYYTPKGRCIHDKGIEPDVEVERINPTMATGEGEEGDEPTPAPAVYHSRLDKLFAIDNQLKTAYQLINRSLSVEQ